MSAVALGPVARMTLLRSPATDSAMWSNTVPEILLLNVGHLDLVVAEGRLESLTVSVVIL